MFNVFLTATLLAQHPIDFKRIQARLKIGDVAASIAEAKELVKEHPEHPGSYELLIKALAESPDHAQLVASWERFNTLYPRQAQDNRVLETLCWGILKQGKGSSSLSTRIIATIGAALTQDAYALDFLIEGMRDSNGVVRMLAVELASLLSDRPLKNEMIALFRKEKNQEVRLALLKAARKLHLVELKDDLQALIQARHSSAEERALASLALLDFSETIDPMQIYQLSLDKRAGLRELAAQLILKFEMRDQISILSRLVFDPQSEVAVSALKAIGLLRIHKMGEQPITEFLDPLTRNHDPMVGITASWALLLQDRKGGIEAFHSWIFHEKADVRATAAAAIAATGPYGVRAALKYLETATDPYVQLNLARLLIGQRVNCAQACEILDRMVRVHQEPLMESEGPFSPIVKSKLTHRPAMPNYPEIVNQTLRLQLLNILAILEYPEALDTLRAFLKTHPYGITGLAAEMYLEQADESAFDFVRQLLQDPDKEVRIEAALVLATWGKDPSVIPVLLEAYHEADRSLKIKILESLGRIGDKSVLPFLVERLKDPSLNFRLIGASVMLQCINH
jgi:HEAT repeat protein